MAYLKLFYNNAEITPANPLRVGPLNASNNEVSAPMEVTLKVDAGFETYGNTTVSFTGTTASKWTICDTSTGTYASTLTISEVINSTGKVFYLKAVATSDESPSNDTTVEIQVNAVVAAV